MTEQDTYSHQYCGYETFREALEDNCSKECWGRTHGCKFYSEEDKLRKFIMERIK